MKTIIDNSVITVKDTERPYDFVGLVYNNTDRPLLLTIHGIQSWEYVYWIDEDSDQTEDDYGWQMLEDETESLALILDAHNYVGFLADPREEAQFEALCKGNYSTRELTDEEVDKFLRIYNEEGDIEAFSGLLGYELDWCECRTRVFSQIEPARRLAC